MKKNKSNINKTTDAIPTELPDVQVIAEELDMEFPEA